MARIINRLGVKKVEKLSAPGLHADGAGLYLRISAGRNGGKRWVFIFRRPADGKRCEMGLGSVELVSLAEARGKAEAARRCVDQRRDPLVEKHRDSDTPSFGEVSDNYIADMGPSWRNAKHRAQWEMTLRVYAEALRSKPVNQITTADVLAVLKPLWQTIPETASRVRGRIERVLDSAKVQGYRSGENPAAWRGHLKLILPPRLKLTRGHHARMLIDELPEFMAKLRIRQAVAARCLEFAILTAARSGEALGATWSEIDVRSGTWTIPADRMKAKREHRVPLSARSLTILEEMRKLAVGEHVFPGQRRGKPLSNMALEMMLRRMSVGDVTVHGFRSCFRDWAGNRTSYPRELAEHALSHVVGDRVEQAYRREDALDRRRPLMDEWADFCGSISGSNVVPMRKAR